jgi:hypothetical protein
MTNRPNQHIQWLAFAALIVVSLGFCLLCVCWNTPLASISDDGWRRTEHGWERIAVWQSRALATASVPVYPAPPPPEKATFRWDTHPAALAFVQLAIVLFALLRLPAGMQSRTPDRPVKLPELVAKSFRASAFG